MDFLALFQCVQSIRTFKANWLKSQHCHIMIMSHCHPCIAWTLIERRGCQNSWEHGGPFSHSPLLCPLVLLLATNLLEGHHISTEVGGVHGQVDSPRVSTAGPPMWCSQTSVSYTSCSVKQPPPLQQCTHQWGTVSNPGRVSWSIPQRMLGQMRVMIKPLSIKTWQWVHSTPHGGHRGGES